MNESLDQQTNQWPLAQPEKGFSISDAEGGRETESSGGGRIRLSAFFPSPGDPWMR